MQISVLKPVNSKHRHIDTIGAGMSFACAVHCLLMPLIIGILPLIGLGFLADHTAEYYFIIFSISFALLSMCWGYRTHGKIIVLLTTLCSAGLITTGFFMVSDVHHLIFVVLGALGITASHLLNRKLCLSCSTCEAHDHEHPESENSSTQKKASCCSHQH